MQRNKREIKLPTCILFVALMSSIIQHTIKIKFYSGIKCTSRYQQRNLRNLRKKEDRLNKVYDSDGEPGPFCDMEDLQGTQDFYEYALNDVLPPDAGKKSLIMKVINMLRK